MNARPGGQQPLMPDTIWEGELQSLTRQVTVHGHPLRNAKGLIEVLIERGFYNLKMKLEVVLKEIASHPDFMNEKTQLEHHINSCGYAFFFILKYHCELNPIEHCWSQAKRHTRAYCNYRITGLRKYSKGTRQRLPKKH